MLLNIPRAHVWSVITFTVILYSTSRSVLAEDHGKNWALLITGASGWVDYSSQSSVCHAYQVFKEHGVPEDQIVVMMFDDIAYNSRNFYTGKLFNHPEGPDVYQGVPHDYTGYNVSAEVFLAVLQGDGEAVYKLTGYHGKVIDSGPSDHVFVYYISHGQDGYLEMPQELPLFASDLNAALQNMHELKRFAKLVFYLEACHSGSMFEDILPKDIDVYAVTSANATELASKCYYDARLRTYLGAYFSCSWMENCDMVDITEETLQEQYDITVKGTPYSNPVQYGDLSFLSWPVSDFVGESVVHGQGIQYSRELTSENDSGLFANSGEMELSMLRQLLSDPIEEGHKEEIRAELEEKLWFRAQTDIFFYQLANTALPKQDADWVLNTHSVIKQRANYENAVRHLLSVCPRLSASVNKFVLGRMNAMVNLSNVLSLEKLLATVDTVVNISPLCDV